VGRFTAVEGATAVFALPNETHRSYCEEVRPEVEAALAARFGRAVPIRLVVDTEDGDDSGPPPATSAPAAGEDTEARPAPGSRPPSKAAPATRPRRAPGVTPNDDSVSAPAVDSDHDDAPDLLDPAVLAAETELAGAGLTPEQRLMQAFPGAEEV
jgi:hypothetical protein